MVDFLQNYWHTRGANLTDSIVANAIFGVALFAAGIFIGRTRLLGRKLKEKVQAQIQEQVNANAALTPEQRLAKRRSERREYNLGCLASFGFIVMCLIFLALMSDAHVWWKIVVGWAFFLGIMNLLTNAFYNPEKLNREYSRMDLFGLYVFFCLLFGTIFALCIYVFHFLQ